MYIHNGVLYTGQNSTKYGKRVCEMAKGEWYDVEFVYNITTTELTIKVNKDGEACGEVTTIPTQGITGMTVVDAMRVQLWGTENAGAVTIDDVVIDEYVEPEVEEPVTVIAENLGAFEGTDGSMATAFIANMEEVTGRLNLTITPSEGEAKVLEIPTVLTDANVVLGLIINNFYDAAAEAIVTVVE